jgi:phospholipid-binding lipoprotein MlaA
MHPSSTNHAGLARPVSPLTLAMTIAVVSGLLTVSGAFAADVSAPPANASAQSQPPDQAMQQEVESDPLAPFNEAMFTFNRKLDDWVLHPVAKGYAYITPVPAREAVGRFFNNVDVIPRFTNNLLQLRLPEAGGEVARLGINSTLGVAGLFDPADHWFGLKEHPDDFGLTLRYYGVPTGPYLMLPFLGPSTIGDAVGRGVDSVTDPLGWLVPWYVWLPADSGHYLGEAVNYRSLHLNQFEEADRYAIDLYGAVQDAYLQTRVHSVQALKAGD